MVKPSIHVSTAVAYRDAKVSTPKIPLKELIAQPVKDWKTHILNDFEPSVFKKYPEIYAIKAELYQAGATFALMSGSGSSVFAIFEKEVKLPELEKENLVFYNV